MHRIFREALDEATGVSESVIVVLVDIREFSAFSMGCDSVDAAMFLKRAYKKLIDLYFPFASFYKSTGDGLLLIVPIGRKKLTEISQEVVASCIKCHSEFGNICDDDPMINFKVPNKIGIGITRGTACCLVSGETIIDYSGRWINLASRLTDLARSSGIVIDGGFNIGLLTEEQKALFKEENVYLKGIAEDETLQIYFTPEFTEIPKYNKQPIAAKRWRHVTHIIPYRDLLKFTEFEYLLESEATSREDIKVIIRHDKVIAGRVDKRYVTIIDDFADFTYSMEGVKPKVCIHFGKLVKRLERTKVKKNMNITIEIDYVEK